MGLICSRPRGSLSDVMKCCRAKQQDKSISCCKVQRAALKIAQKLLQENSGKKFSDVYEIKDTISFGATCTVYKAQHIHSCQQVAVKIMPKAKLACFSKITGNATCKIRVLQEVAAMKYVEEHPSAPKLKEVFEDDKNFYLVMEYYTGGELFDHVVDKGKDHFTEAEAAKIMKALMEFLAYCHEIGVVHADVKPENIVYSTPDGDLKLLDFGMSVFCRPHESLDNVFGTIDYCSPEMANKNCGQKTDVWSAGVLLYFLLCGSHPFAYKNKEAVLCRLKQCPRVAFSACAWDDASDGVKDFVRELLNPDVMKRPTASQALKLPWLCDLTSASKSSFSLDTATFRALKNFAQKSRIKRVLWDYIVSGVPEEDFSKQKNQFDQLDLDSNGTVDLDELKVALQKVSPTLRQDELSTIFSAVDVDASGGIDVHEFVVATLSALGPEFRADLARKSFMKVDKNQKGIIPTQELVNSLVESIEKKHKLGIDVDSDELNLEIASMDLDGDGNISIEEFTGAFKTTFADS